MANDLINPSIPQLGYIKIGGLKEEIRKTRSGVEWRSTREMGSFQRSCGLIEMQEGGWS